MMHVRSILLFSLWLAALLPLSSARAERWEIVAGQKGNDVIFHSKATLESFEGRTDLVTGWVEYAMGSDMATVDWSIEVDLASLDTGIGLRNTHMRENHLHVDQFPVARFEGSSASADWPSEIPVEEESVFLLAGALSLHGVTREREISVHVRRDENGILSVRTEFMISLADHEIPLPKFLMMKLADTQRIEVSFRAHPPDEVTE
jgi:polyisoprenoid-binding protein YceI